MGAVKCLRCRGHRRRGRGRGDGHREHQRRIAGMAVTRGGRPAWSRNVTWARARMRYIRRYLKPVLGCLRRNRRRVFVAAVTRYLKSSTPQWWRISGALLVGRQPGGSATESDEGTGGNAAGSGVVSARDLACNQRTPGHRWQADPARRAACGPSTGSGAAALFQQAGTATGSNELSVAKADQPGSVRELCG